MSDERFAQQMIVEFAAGRTAAAPRPCNSRPAPAQRSAADPFVVAGTGRNAPHASRASPARSSSCSTRSSTRSAAAVDRRTAEQHHARSVTARSARARRQRIRPCRRRMACVVHLDLASTRSGALAYSPQFDQRVCCTWQRGRTWANTPTSAPRAVGRTGIRRSSTPGSRISGSVGAGDARTTARSLRAPAQRTSWMRDGRTSACRALGGVRSECTMPGRHHPVHVARRISSRCEAVACMNSPVNR